MAFIVGERLIQYTSIGTKFTWPELARSADRIAKESS